VKKSFVLVSIFLISSFSFASNLCEYFQNDGTYTTLRSGSVLTKENWKSVDVLADMDYSRCADAVTQTVIQVENKQYWMFKTHKDACDGGNSYGAIYSYDLKTPIAHIYDSEIVCQEDWRKESLAANHKCDVAAEEFAKEKMKAFGFEFDDLSSNLQLRHPYAYSFIKVSGKITNKDNRKAVVNVVTQIKNCKFASATIEGLQL